MKHVSEVGIGDVLLKRTAEAGVWKEIGICDEELKLVTEFPEDYRCMVKISKRGGKKQEWVAYIDRAGVEFYFSGSEGNALNWDEKIENARKYEYDPSTYFIPWSKVLTKKL